MRLFDTNNVETEWTLGGMETGWSMGMTLATSASQCPPQQGLHSPWRLIPLLSLEWSLQAWFSYPEPHKPLFLHVPPTSISPSLENLHLI